MSIAFVTSCKPTILDNSVFSIIKNLRKQHKRTNLNWIDNELTKSGKF